MMAKLSSDLLIFLELLTFQLKIHFPESKASLNSGQILTFPKISRSSSVVLSTVGPSALGCEAMMTPSITLLFML